MNLRCAVSRCGSFTSCRAVLVVAILLATPCAALAAPAPGWHPEYGFAFRPLIGVGGLADVSGPAAGFDLDLHIVNESGGLGMRAVLGSNRSAVRSSSRPRARSCSGV